MCHFHFNGFDGIHQLHTLMAFLLTYVGKLQNMKNSPQQLLDNT